jgi:hypothetical protein
MTNTMIQKLTQESSATAALEKVLCTQANYVISKEKPMIKRAALKRSQNNVESSFDMSEFEEVSKQVEQSIAFPSIEWNFSDVDDEDNYNQPSKRSCHGFSRSQGSLDLASLMGSCHRRGSNGSLC